MTSPDGREVIFSEHTIKKNDVNAEIHDQKCVVLRRILENVNKILSNYRSENDTLF